MERSFPGFSSDSLHGKLGVRAGNTGILYFNDCEVPAANRVGEEGEGFTIAMSAIDQGRYTVAAGSVGLAQACLDASVKYAHERKTFGSEIGEHQLVQRRRRLLHVDVINFRAASPCVGVAESSTGPRSDARSMGPAAAFLSLTSHRQS